MQCHQEEGARHNRTLSATIMLLALIVQLFARAAPAQHRRNARNVPPDDTSLIPVAYSRMRLESVWELLGWSLITLNKNVKVKDFTFFFPPAEVVLILICFSLRMWGD
jgi:hypothetical protein